MALAPPRPKGPPLNALRAFEAAARLGSFAAAAEELSVTAGAISQHIKQIEGWAGTALFARRAQGVTLTSAGRTLLAPLTLAFDNISDATSLLRTLSPKPTLNIATLPSIAQLWLQPRLAQVRAARRLIAVCSCKSPQDRRKKRYWPKTASCPSARQASPYASKYRKISRTKLCSMMKAGTMIGHSGPQPTACPSLPAKTLHAIRSMRSLWPTQRQDLAS